MTTSSPPTLGRIVATSGSHQSKTPFFEVAIIGAGFGGIGSAVELTRSGIDNIVLIEKNSDIGGTWHANTYPGVAVDIPSVYYSFSYEAPKQWTQFFARGHEVKAYANQVVDSFGLRDRILLNTTFAAGVWDAQQHLWRCTLTTGESFTCRHLISAPGTLEIPKLPDIDGVEGFAGKTVHTARWDHDFDYRGKRIGVIGTGATALQLIPEMAEVAGQLTVFQRRGIWCGPKPDFRVDHGLKQAMKVVPGLRRAIRLGVIAVCDSAMIGLGLAHGYAPFLPRVVTAAAKVFYRAQLSDHPQLTQALTPDYQALCKRPSFSNTYLRTYTKPNVDLVTTPIQKITPAGVVTEDGTEHELDVLVCATGFKIASRESMPPYSIVGRGGVELGEFFDQHRQQAYQGVTVPGFPNFYLVGGPYSFAAGSYLAMVECVASHAARAITEARRRGATAVEIKREPHEAYWRKSVKRAEASMWLGAICDNSGTYYRNYQGDLGILRPSTQLGMWLGNKRFPFDHYTFSTAQQDTPSRADMATAAAVKAGSR